VPRAQDHDVLIAGAGIVGAAVAWHLAEAGLRVALADAAGPAAAASGASDGAVSVASKKPGVMARLATGSLVYTSELAARGPLGAAYQARPSYVFGTGAAEMGAIDALIDKLAQLGGGPVRVTADGGPGMLPGVGPGVERLVALSGEGHMPGHKAVRAYLAHPGISPLWPAPLVGYEADDAGVTVDLGGRRLRVGVLVAALGVATPALFPGLPVLPRAGQLVVTDAGPQGALPGALTAAAYLLAKTETPGGAEALPPVVIDPLATGQFLIGSSREDHADPTRVDFATLRRLLGRATAAFPALADRRVIRAFAGVRAAVADGLPIVGPLPGAPRVIIATGFEGDGICLSALIGREVAAMARGIGPGAEWAADLAALSPARFIAAAQERVA